MNLRCIRWILGAALIIIGSVGSPVEAVSSAKRPPKPNIVTVNPPFGAYPANLRIRITPREAEVIAGIRRETRDFGSINHSTHNLLTWHIEPGVEESPTFILARLALFSLQRMLESYGVLEGQATHIVVGRTQSYLAETVNFLGCSADLSSTFGQYFMGSTLCGSKVLVMNLTGYLILDSLRPITREDELQTEPLISTTPYLVVDRNTSGLAHEWAHSVRAVVAGGSPPAGEPIWLGEGLAEFAAGLARVNAYFPELTFAELHVMKVRLFADWPYLCSTDLSFYETSARRLNNCEYILGFLAVELLVSNYGGLTNILRTYREVAKGIGFREAFHGVYGLTISEFEDRAGDYIRTVAAIGFGQQFRRSVRG